MPAGEATISKGVVKVMAWADNDVYEGITSEV